MSTPVSFQLGILPERKLDRRALAASYGLLVLLIIVMINVGWIWPDSMNISRQYHVTELIPMPRLQPERLKIKQQPPVVQAKLLPPAPVFEAPKLTVPREIRAPKPHYRRGCTQDRSEQLHPCGGEANYRRSPAIADRAHWRVWQFSCSHNQRADTESSDWWLWRSQRNSGARQSKCPLASGAFRRVRSATRAPGRATDRAVRKE